MGPYASPRLTVGGHLARTRATATTTAEQPLCNSVPNALRHAEESADNCYGRAAVVAIYSGEKTCDNHDVGRRRHYVGDQRRRPASRVRCGPFRLSWRW